MHLRAHGEFVETHILVPMLLFQCPGGVRFLKMCQCKYSLNLSVCCVPENSSTDSVKSAVFGECDKEEERDLNVGCQIFPATGKGQYNDHNYK